MPSSIKVGINGGALGLGLVLVLLTSTVCAAFYQVTANSQRVTNSEITIANIATEVDGLLVIHAANKDGEPNTNKVLGVSPVRAGESTNLKVLLQQPVTPGERLIAVLYRDNGEKGKFEPGIDKLIVRPVSNRFTIE
jgi:hypothetical protein